MTITLNHTIVPARDKEAAARFFARIFGLRFDRASGHFAPVRVNDTLTGVRDEHLPDVREAKLLGLRRGCIRRGE